MILPHPGGGERNERQPEQEVDVGPQHHAVDMADQMKEMMVVVPVDGYVDKAQHIAEKNRDHRCQGAEAGILRYLHLQYHDRNDDGDHPIGECQQPLLFHGIVPPGPLRAD
jgi:hypothetical protein